jgi:hypothetical protein
MPSTLRPHDTANGNVNSHVTPKSSVAAGRKAAESRVDAIERTPQKHRIRPWAGPLFSFQSLPGLRAKQHPEKHGSARGQVLYFHSNPCPAYGQVNTSETKGGERAEFRRISSPLILESSTNRGTGVRKPDL